MSRVNITGKAAIMDLDNLQDDSLDVSSTDSMTMLELIAEVNSVISEVGMGKEGVSRTRLWLNALARRQGLSARQMFIIAVIMNYHVEGGAYMSEIASHCNYTNMSVLLLLSDIKELIAEGYLCEVKRRKDEYDVSEELFEAYIENRAFKQRDYKCEDLTQLLSEYYDITHKLHEDDIDNEIFAIRLRRLVDSNLHLPIVKTLKSMQLSETGEAIVLHLCRHLFINSTHNIPIMGHVLFLIPEGPARNLASCRLHSGEDELFKKNIVEHTSNDGLCDSSSIQLSKKAVKSLLGNFKAKTHTRQSNSTLIMLHQSIPEKQLFFDETVAQQVGRLGDILRDGNFRNIQGRLRSKGLRTGFTCIFYGAPGTGKTETALQLAKATGRDVMQVNISEIHSKWVGESEKNIQELFNDYRMQVKVRKRCPILLFNEADAIFNKRSENTQHAVNRMENSIQNIILQEMEKLDGILIATTNLQGNLDKAFERRFLYKIEFSRPSLEARANIWRSLLPNIDEFTAHSLARDYDLSGGQIENVARKSMVDEILYGAESITLAALRQYCNDERLDKGVHRIVGFNAA